MLQAICFSLLRNIKPLGADISNNLKLGKQFTNTRDLHIANNSFYYVIQLCMT